MSIVFLPKGSPSHTAKSRPGARPSSSSSQADRVYHVGPQGIPEEFSYKLLHGYPARSSHDWFPAIYHDFSWCFLWFSIDFGDLPAMMTSQVWKHHQKTPGWSTNIHHVGIHQTVIQTPRQALSKSSTRSNNNKKQLRIATLKAAWKSNKNSSTTSSIVLRPTGCWTKVFLHAMFSKLSKPWKKDLQCCIMG